VKRKRLTIGFVGSLAMIAATALTAAFFMSPHTPISQKVPAQTTISVPALDPAEVLLAADLPNPQSPLRVIQARQAGVPFIMIEGGVAQTRRSAMRCGVKELVEKADAQAGVNGTFFANASVQGTDNVLIGPSLCGDESEAVFNRADSYPALRGRPLVLLSPGRTRILPFNPDRMDSQTALESRLPGLTDVFLGGVWLVHNGIASDRQKIDSYHVHDAEDPRRRAFFCVLPDGRLGVGATTYVTPSSALARALQDQGVSEAVLLDSGFSTSLVYGQKILVTGHTSPGIPSRPIPHALLLFSKPPAPVLTKPSHFLESGPVLLTDDARAERRHHLSRCLPHMPLRLRGSIAQFSRVCPKFGPPEQSA